MIHKSNLKGKYVTYIDKNGAWRTNKVVRVSGNTLTVKDAAGVKRRVHKDKVIARQFRKTGQEPILWGKRGKVLHA